LKIPTEILELFDRESAGVSHGAVVLALHLRDGKPRFTINKEISIIPETDVQSVGLPSDLIEKKKEAMSKAPIVRKGGEK
jgi:hypothetical protein